MVKGSKSSSKLNKSENKTAQKGLLKKVKKERLEQQQESSSVSSLSHSTDSADSHDSYVKSLRANVEEEINIFELLQQTDNESFEDSEESEQMPATPFADDTSFPQFFGEVPDVDDVSEDISIVPQTTEMPLTFEYDAVNMDGGKFVNPLTGFEIKDKGEARAHRSKEQNVIDEREEESEASSSSSEDSITSDNLILATDTLQEEKGPKDDYIDETLAAFLELEKQSLKVKEEEVDWEAVVKAKKAQALQEHIFNFVSDLIDKVVHDTEHLSPEKFLEKNLDKRELVIELLHLWPNLQSARNICTFLNQQVVQHFRRKKSFRCILEDSPNTVVQQKQKLDSALEHLDQALAKEKHFKEISTQLQVELNQQYKQLKEQTEGQIEMFENLVRKHICREGFNRLNAEVDRSLSIMSKYRKEISDVRFSLLLQQHSETKLQDQINKMDDLGNGLNMKSFTTLQAENQTLSKKIEERNDDLNKLRRRCNNNLHILAHYKENQQIIHTTIEQQKTILDSAVQDKRLLRARLLSLKLQRNRIHDEIKKLRVQGGLLDKPDLLYDYDQTVKLVCEKKEKVESLRETLLSIQSKTEQLIAHCESSNVY